MSSWMIPLLITAICVHALCRGVDLYAALLDGIRAGLKVCLQIFPPMLAMLVVMSMLQASGGMALFSHALAPLLQPLGIPEECLPLALLRPFSGSGALSLGASVITAAGADSTVGRIAAVMLGSSETSVYVIAVYSAALGLHDTRYTLAAALCADLAAFLMSGVAVHWLLSA